jgi:hypothetical protein
LIIVDECHAIPGGDVGMYRKFFAELHKFCPDVRIIGATGTPFRGNGEWLTTVENPLFSAIVARVTMDDLLEQGYLSPLTTTPTTTKLDAEGVKTVGGDYVVSELARAIDRPELVSAACAEAVCLSADRKKWLVYCVTVDHAMHVAAELNELGVGAKIITGDHLIVLNAELQSFADNLGACERIKKTPIPYAYSLFLKKIIFIYVFTMPIGFVLDYGYWAVPVVTFVFYAFASIEVIAEEIEDPFGTEANDLPTDSISETIRANLHDIL